MSAKRKPMGDRSVRDLAELAGAATKRVRVTLGQEARSLDEVAKVADPSAKQGPVTREELVAMHELMAAWSVRLQALEQRQSLMEEHIATTMTTIADLNRKILDALDRPVVPEYDARGRVVQARRAPKVN